MADFIPDVAFSDNTQQRTPCVLVLDGSGSMAGEPVAELNAGLATLAEQLKAHPTTALRVQLLVIRVGDRGKAEVVQDWVDAIDFQPPRIDANGLTPLGAGMALALQKVEAQKRNYDRNGISSTRPWILLISDGEPNDPGWEGVAARCRQAEKGKRVVVFAIGTEKADLRALGQFSNNPPKRLRGLAFGDLFVWLSRSMSVVSTSTPGSKVQLPAASWSDLEV